MAHLARVSIFGAMPSGEEWSINPVFAFATPLAISTDECLAAATAIDAVTVPTRVLQANLPPVTFTGVRFEARDVNGTLQSVAEHLKTTPVASTGTGPHPPQTSIVVSLRTADSTARGKGRLYMPATAQTMNNTTLRFDANTVALFLTDFNTWMTNIRTAIRGVGGMNTAVLAVWSRVGLDTRVVLSLRAGDVPDTQRRRRDKFVESYVTAAIPAAV